MDLLEPRTPTTLDEVCCAPGRWLRLPELERSFDTRPETDARLACSRTRRENAAQMLLVLQDDGCVYAYASPEEAATDIEALDVEHVVWKVYDEQARPYRVEWLRPNRYGKTLGFLESAEGGEYRFVVAGPAEPAALLEMLREANEIFPDTARDPVRELERRLAGPAQPE
jgi:hypothetical protein